MSRRRSGLRLLFRSPPPPSYHVSLYCKARHAEVERFFAVAQVIREKMLKPDDPYRVFTLDGRALTLQNLVRESACRREYDQMPQFFLKGMVVHDTLLSTAWWCYSVGGGGGGGHQSERQLLKHLGVVGTSSSSHRLYPPDAR